MKQLALAVCLCLLARPAATEPAKPEAWKVAPEPVLTPGLPHAWDDYAIVAPTILRHPNKLTLWFEGVAFDRFGLHRAAGLAESSDGNAWTKHDQNPLFSPALKKNETWSSPSIARWHEKVWVVYAVSEDPFAREKKDQQFDPVPVSLRLSRSDDGSIWSDVRDATLPPPTEDFFPVRPCLYGDGDALHLWWLAPVDQKVALLHSVSRDGDKWSAPNSQAAKEIDEREICCARVYPSGGFYILSYVAQAEGRNQRSDKREYSVVTKISRDARTWVAKGPPEFPLPDHWMHAPPLLLFEQDGARLFYSAKEPDETVALRSARCSKANYASP
jgi:hypothetical protein